MVRTRFAPSPTGALHVGNARIAVLDWLFTRHHDGAFIVRIEDTDRERNVEGALDRILDDLSWLGLTWDEGPLPGGGALGAAGPYRQTARLPLYRAAAERLRTSGHAYLCYCTAAELDAMRRAAIARGETPHYDRRCAHLSPAQRQTREAAGLRPAVRFQVPDAGTIVVQDEVRGVLHVDAREIGDFVLLRADGLPTYNFAAVVDDVAMGITHVIRGAAHLSNTPRQVLLYEALGADPPVFAHVPMVLGADRQKLSKRHGARAVADYRAEGYHPDALVNYLSLLSWSSPTGEEVLDRNRLVAEISLDRIGRADVVFDPAKLRWLSGQHIARMPLDALVAAVAPFLDRERIAISDALLPVAVAAIRTHLQTFADINEHLAVFNADSVAIEEATRALGAATLPVLEAARTVLAAAPDWTEPALKDAMREIGRASVARGPALYEPLRLALTGSPHGPPFAALLLVRGREASLGALDAAVRRIRATQIEAG